MRIEYNFNKGKRGPDMKTPKGKTRITMRLDDEIIVWFKRMVEDAGGGNYQSLINQALRAYITEAREPLEQTLR